MAGILYCPHWSNKPGGCQWSHDSNQKTGQRYLEQHLKIVHRGQPVPAVAEPVRVRAAVKPEPRPTGRPPTYTRDDVTRALRVALQEIGRAPSANWWKTHRRQPSETAIVRLFGTWADALTAAGLTEPVITAEECVAQLQAAARVLGHAPSSKLWKRERRKPSFSTIILRFGSWTAALAAAGLEVHQPERRAPRKPPPVHWLARPVYQTVTEFLAAELPRAELQRLFVLAEHRARTLATDAADAKTECEILLAALARTREEQAA